MNRVGIGWWGEGEEILIRAGLALLALALSACQSGPIRERDGNLEIGKSYVIAHDGAPLYAEGIRSVFDRPVGTLSRGTEVELLSFDEHEARVRYGGGKEAYVPPRLLADRVVARPARAVAGSGGQVAPRPARSVAAAAATGGRTSGSGSPVSASQEVEVARAGGARESGVVEAVEAVEQVPPGAELPPPAPAPVRVPVTPPAPEPAPAPELVPETAAPPAPAPAPGRIEPPEMVVDEVGILPVPELEDLSGTGPDE